MIIKIKNKAININNKLLKIIIIYAIIVLIIIVTIFTMVKIYGNDTDNKIDPNNIKGFVIDNNDVVKEKLNIDKISVYRVAKNKAETLSLDDYVTGVVCAEMPALFEIEALKAQAVAARTYAVNKIIRPCSIAHGADICDTTDCQVYIDKEEARKKWGEKKWKEYYDKIYDAVKSTSGEVIVYDNKIITNPQYFAISSGKTEDAKDVFNEDIPYLKSVSSEGENEASKYKSTVTISNNSFIQKMKNSNKNINLNSSNLSNQVKIKSYTEAGSVKYISIGGQDVSGIDFRKIFGLNSTYFNISFGSANVTISCTGYGHDVGMSQWGARVMAREGKTYKQILAHYYTGTSIMKY